jgi:hypothetical protein
MFPRQTDPINPGTIIFYTEIYEIWLLIRLVFDGEVQFGENDDARPRNVEFLQCLADDLFGFTVRVGIGLVINDVVLTIRTRKGKPNGECGKGVYELYPMC